jgi:hypothetical protein
MTTRRPEEDEALARLAAFVEGDYFRGHDMVAEKIYLRGDHPYTQAVVLFRLGTYPGDLYGWAHPLRDDEESDGRSHYLEMHFAEAVLTRAGSDRYVPDDDGVTWLPNFHDDML